MKCFILFILSVLFFTSLTKAETNPDPLRVTLQPSVISLDPGGVQDSQSWLVSRQINCQLVQNFGPNYILDAAESIKYITPLKIRLKLNPKAKFHDNTPVTSQDVIASLDYIKESRNILSNLFIWIEKIEIIDDKTILFSLKKQIPQFLNVLSSTNFKIFKKDFILQAKKDKKKKKKPLGCGKYKVSEFTDQYIKLIPVHQGLPIIFYLKKENQLNSNELKQYDIITVNVMGYSKELNDFNIIEIFDPLQFYIGLNSKSKFWKNSDERCSFLAKLDAKNLVASYGKNSIEANDLLPKGVLGYSNSEDFNGYATHFSKKISSNALFCVAYLTVSMQEKHKMEYLSMIKKIYPNTTMKPIANVKKFGKLFAQDCDALLFAWRSNYLDGYEFLTMFEDSDANFSGLMSKEFTKQIIKSQNFSSAENRANAYREIIDQIKERCIVKPLITTPMRRFYIRKDINMPGIGLVSIHQYDFSNIIRKEKRN